MTKPMTTIIRLCHIRNIAPTGWVRIENSKQHHKPIYDRSDVEIATTFDAIGPSSVDDVEKSGCG